MSPHADERPAADDPYRAPDSRAVVAREKAPWHERVLVVLAFLASALPFAFALLVSALQTVLSVRERPPLLIDATPSAMLMVAVLVNLVMFVAGLMLLLRRRSALWLYPAAIAAIAASALWHRDWVRGDTIWCVIGLACLAYAMLLRRRGRLR